MSEETMRAVAITETGGPEVLVESEVPRPMPGEGEVRIRVRAAGVNRPDILQRIGAYRLPPDASDLPGLEVAGTVDAVGAGVTAYRIGDRVCALCNGGGYAEYVSVAAGQVLPVPGSLDWVSAAALPETFFTVWVNVFDHGKLQSGETLLVHGGSSGIGTTAIQLAKALGARVITTAGSDGKCQACLDLGAELAINYRDNDFVEEIQRLGGGVDVVLDMVGGDYVCRNLEVLVDGGRHVSIAFLRGSTAQVNLAPVMLKRLVLTGSTLRPRGRDEKAAIASALRERVWPLLERGEVVPQIDSTFPLASAADAHRRMETSEHIGKIVLTVGSDERASTA